MQFFIRHWEKLVLAVFVITVCAWGYGLLSKSLDLQEEVATEEGLPSDVMAEELEPLSSDDFTAMRYVDEPRHEWVKIELEEEAAVSAPADLTWCINSECDHWLPVDIEVCPYCETDQEEVVVEREPDEEIAPLERRMRLVDASRDVFGAVLQRVTVIPDQPPEEWDLQISARDEDGRRRTRFRQKGDTLNVNGEEYEIVGVEHKEETRYNPRISDEETIDVSEAELEGPEGESIILVRGEEAIVGPWQVRLELTDPRDRDFRRRFRISSDEVLEFQDVDGTRKRFEVELRDEDLVVLRPEEAPEREIEIGSDVEPVDEHRLDFPEGREFFEEDWLEEPRRR